MPLRRRGLWGLNGARPVEGLMEMEARAPNLPTHRSDGHTIDAHQLVAGSPLRGDYMARKGDKTTLFAHGRKDRKDRRGSR